MQYPALAYWHGRVGGGSENVRPRSSSEVSAPPLVAPAAWGSAGASSGPAHPSVTSATRARILRDRARMRGLQREYTPDRVHFWQVTVIWPFRAPQKSVAPAQLSVPGASANHASGASLLAQSQSPHPE